MDNKINLEELAQTAETEHNHIDTEQKESNTEPPYQKEMEKIMQLPFTVAMQNLKLKESEVVEAGKELLLKGTVKKKIELPLNSYILLESRKASDELDYFTFLLDAVSKQFTQAEFDYLMRIRNVAAALVELKIGDDIHDFRNKSIQERMDFLLDMSAVFINMIFVASQDFWSTLLLLMHPKAIDFLTKALQN